MGCWNGTCAVSNLPITQGTKVRGFILVPNEYSDEKLPLGSGICYSTDLFTPLSIAIRGEYNDYGAMENIIKDSNTDLILKYINQKIKDGKLKLTERDDEKPKQFKNIEALVEAICRCEEIGFMMVIESIYIAGIEAVEANKTSHYDEDRKLKNIIKDFKIAKKYILETEAKEKLKKGLKNLKIKSADEDDMQSVLRSIMGYVLPKRPDAKHQHSDNTASYFLKSVGQTNFIAEDFSRECGKDLVIAKDIPAKMLAGHYAFCCFMSASRKMWIPQCGQGSQSSEYKIYRIMAEATLKHIEGVKAQHAEDVDLTNPDELEHFNKFY